MEAQPHPADAAFSTARDPCLPEWERRAAFDRLIVRRGLWPRHGDASLYEFATAAARAVATIRCSRLGRTADAVDPEDVTQEALTLLYLKLHEIESADRIPGWLYVAIQNLVKQRIENGWHFLVAKEVTETVPAPQRASSDRGPSLESLTRFYDAVLGAINSLSVTLRGVAYLHLIEERPLADIARDLKLKPATVRQRWCRAREALQRQLANLKLPGSDEETDG
ncbi:MAG: sigma-70 family RNA polymerase sigma factor [Candidatus Eisenbacteria bacterium]